MIPCRSCTYKAQDYTDLARHIKASKTGHRKGKRWAASYLTKVNVLNQKRDLSRSPITKEEREAVKEAKEETHRELSGEERLTETVCPHCKGLNHQVLPVEYLSSPRAWVTSQGLYVIMCDRCKR